LIGVVWIGGVLAVDPGFVPWLLPVAGALVLAIPLSTLTSRVSLGRKAARARLFLIPEETHPPREIIEMASHLARLSSPALFRDAVVDPIVNATACLAAAYRAVPLSSREGRRALAATALGGGPDGLTVEQKSILLDDPDALAQLHVDVWTATGETAARWR
jgi:membrane glycosyltransferase